MTRCATRSTPACTDASIARTVARITRADLIVVDDIGMLPARQDDAKAFYRPEPRSRIAGPSPDCG